MKKLIATIGIITALGAGAFALNTVMPASATGNATTQDADPAGPCATGPRAKFKGVLDKLVANNTITQAQEDAIIQAFKDEVTANGNGAGQPGPGRPGRGGPRLKALGGMLEAAAGKITVTVDELKAALQSGKSVAEVANEHQVAPADVVQAIVDAGNAKIDQAVTDGKLQQPQADKLKQHLPEAADKFVNHTKPQGC